MSQVHFSLERYTRNWTQRSPPERTRSLEIEVYICLLQYRFFIHKFKILSFGNVLPLQKKKKKTVSLKKKIKTTVEKASEGNEA